MDSFQGQVLLILEKIFVRVIIEGNLYSRAVSSRKYGKFNFDFNVSKTAFAKMD